MRTSYLSRFVSCMSVFLWRASPHSDNTEDCYTSETSHTSACLVLQVTLAPHITRRGYGAALHLATSRAPQEEPTGALALAQRAPPMTIEQTPASRPD